MGALFRLYKYLKNYWPAVLVSLIFMLIATGLNLAQ